jgi:hypothetical protein
LGAGAKVEELATKPRFGGAKTMTNNLPILSVLGVRNSFILIMKYVSLIDMYSIS